MANISFVTVGDTTYPMSLPFCNCETAASTTAKTATLSNFSLSEGTTVFVKFKYANSASAPTLNINSTGAKAIKAYGTIAPTLSWTAGSVILFVYDGTNYIMTNVGAMKNGSVSYSDTELDCTPTAKTTTGTVNRATTGSVHSSSTSTDYVRLGTRVTSPPSSGMYLKVSGGSNSKTGESCTVTRSAGVITAGTKVISSTGNATTDDGYYPMSILAGSVSNNVTPASQTVSGIIDSGKLIKIGKGFYTSDLYYQAAEGGGGDWITGNFTKSGSPGAANEQSLYVWAGSYNSAWMSVGGSYSAKYGTCTHYMSNKSVSNEICDYYQFDACTSASPLKLLVLGDSDNWAIFIGSVNYEPSGSSSNSYYFSLSGSISSMGGKSYVFEIWPEANVGSIYYRYKQL